MRPFLALLFLTAAGASCTDGLSQPHRASFKEDAGDVVDPGAIEPPRLRLPVDGGFLHLSDQQAPTYVTELVTGFHVKDDENFKVAWVRDGSKGWQFIEAGLEEGRQFQRTAYQSDLGYAPSATYLPNSDLLLGGLRRHEDPSQGTYVWLRGDGGETPLFVCSNSPHIARTMLDDGTMLLGVGYCRADQTCPSSADFRVSTLRTDGTAQDDCRYHGMPTSLVDRWRFGPNGKSLFTTVGYSFYDVALDGGTVVSVTGHRCAIYPNMIPSYLLPGIDGGYLFRTVFDGGILATLGMFHPTDDGGCVAEELPTSPPPEALAVEGSSEVEPFPFRRGIAWTLLGKKGPREYGIAYFDASTGLTRTVFFPHGDVRYRLFSDGDRVWTSVMEHTGDGGWSLSVRRITEVDDW